MGFNKLITSERTCLMGCAMIAIILFHQPFFSHNPVVDFFHLYGFWGVEVFLLLSGFGIVRSLQRNSLRQYYLNRARRLLPACLFVGVIKLLLTHSGLDGSWTRNPFLLVTGLDLWFIYAIVVYYALAPLIYACLKRHGLATLLTICVLTIAGTHMHLDNSPYYLVNHLSWLNGRLPVFVFGMYLALYPLKYRLRSIFATGMVFLVLCMACCLMWKMGQQWRLSFYHLMLLPATLAMCLLGHGLIWLAEKIRCTGVLTFFGKYSLELYLWHEFIFTIFCRKTMFGDMGTPLRFLIAVALSLVAAYLTSLAVSRLMNLRKSRAQ